MFPLAFHKVNPPLVRSKRALFSFLQAHSPPGHLSSMVLRGMQMALYLNTSAAQNSQTSLSPIKLFQQESIQMCFAAHRDLILKFNVSDASIPELRLQLCLLACEMRP